MSVAREEILGRVRAALAGDPAGEVAVARGYRTSSDLSGAALVDRFAERAEAYKATVRRVDAAGATEAIRRLQGRFVVPSDLAESWLPADFVRDDGGLDHRELDAVAGVVTGCALAIAETGTIVLDAGAEQGRRAITLLPDFHVCIVPADRIVASVPEAIRALRGSLPRPLTFMSGPSATSDIELNRVEGVHGPRRLEILIVGTA
ncbi:lactate utilization protein C [Skermanella sp. TT6]|uniref:Lactate utilization protein C n=1 Tax=Skermanella cutis TaxID=2775420 RepID=A0ABX7BA97_9PROT|nr:lactate utilization protein C [Skermanella sp. TT6]QQP91312.1 lactate utilization protein C [Skermanella sp. TT6]